MPQCVFKSCKNNARKSNLSAGVSYFRFPSNPFTCAEWISIVARERKDEFYKPAKNSVICSEHFDKLQITGNTNRCRLVKTAVPKLQIQPPSEDLQLPPSEDSLLLATTNTNRSVSDSEELSPSSSSESDITQKATYHQDQEDASLSDLISVCETPKNKFLNKQISLLILTTCKIIDKKSKKIQTLQKVNKRLVNKINLLKNTVKLLKKKTNYRPDNIDRLNKKCSSCGSANGINKSVE